MIRRFSAFSVCVVGFVASGLVACGDNESPVGASALANTGGKGDGGTTSDAGAGGDGGIAGDASGGTTSEGGALSTATTSEAGSTSGGATSAGGTSAGGTSAGGTSAGGSSKGGTSSTSTSTLGGSTSGGTTSTTTSTSLGGNTTIGGSSATTTTAAGGVGPVGGTSSVGGTTSMGGTSTATTTGPVVVPCSASFVMPVSGEILNDVDDVSGSFCQSGFAYDVVVATTAPDGTSASLFVGGSSIATTTVSGAVARFAAAPLGSQGGKVLQVDIGTGPASCSTGTESISISCVGIPSCSVASKTFDAAARTDLNAVPVASGGDRQSSEGSPYQAGFTVTTSVEDGQPVELAVDGGAPIYSVAKSGVASFNATLVPDGTHQLIATCTTRAQAKGVSTPVAVDVDTAAPVFTAMKGTGTNGSTISALADGDHFVAADDADPATAGLQLRICSTTTSTDAVDLPDLSGTNEQNHCVSQGGNAAVCAAITSANASSACVNWTCNNDTPFDLDVFVRDGAQNVTKKTINNLTCASTSPSVAFVDPVADTSPFSDLSKRVLSATNTAATRKDKNATVSGAQYDVKVCTSAAVGSSAVLKVGRQGSALNQVATGTAAADTGSAVCAGNYANYIQFSDVTLPESLTNASFQLSQATELSVTVTAANLATTTAIADLWVDSTNPTLTLNSPVGLCGSYTASAADVTKSLVFGTPIASVANPVNLLVTNPDATQSTYTGTTLTFSQCTINPVTFKVGTSTIAASVTEPSGNTGTLSGTCSVQVGSTPPPTVTWQTPLATNDLVASSTVITGGLPDADTLTGGWQGELKVCTSLTGASAAGMTVTFAANGTPIGSPVNIDQTTGCASLNPATVPEGTAVQLTATTSAGASAAGSASITVASDVTVPSAPTGLAATVKDRRQTSFKLDWTAPADGTLQAAGYDVRISKSALNSGNFGAAEAVLFSGSPAVAGVTDSIEIGGRLIENDYYFAVRAIDLVGNQSPIVATATPTRASFIAQTLAAPVASSNFGYVIDGSSDINGDGFSDVLVGASNGFGAYAYFGSANGPSASPSLSFTGNNVQFGTSIASVGDLNGDGIADIAIGAFREGDGKAYVYYGRTTWASTTLTTANADVDISVDRAADGNYTGSWFGFYIARLGDFNGDGVDDFAVGAPQYNSANLQGQVSVILGRRNGLPAAISLPSAFGSRATKVDGDLAAKGRFGMTIVGLGKFYPSANSTMVVAAPLSASGALASAGRLFAFGGPTGTPATISYTTALATTFGSAASQQLGFAGLSAMGDLGPGALPAVGAALPAYLAPGRAQISSGTTSTGPFATAEMLSVSETGTTSQFGRLLIGGALQGTNIVVSVVGSAKADLIVSTRTGSGPRLLIVDGTKVSIAGGTSAVDAISDVVLPMPTGFTDFGRYNTAIRDIDGDGYTDFAVGDIAWSGTIDGRVIVFR